MARPEQSIIPPRTFQLISTGVPAQQETLPDGTRGLLVGVAGNLNVTMINDDELNNLPLIVGLNPGFFKVIRTGATSSAQNIWAVL